MKYELTGWKLKGLWPNELDFARKNTDWAAGATDWIDAAVPGGVHADLQAAGLIEDPLFDDNCLRCEWVEHRAWAYRCEMPVPEGQPAHAELQFTGIDHDAEILVDGTPAARVRGMFRTHIVDVTGRLRPGGTARVEAVFDPAPEEAPLYGYTARTHTQKPRFGYRWDFSARLVNIGLYDRVFLRTYSFAAVRAAHIRTVPTDGGWQVRCELTVEGFTERDARWEASLGDTRVTVPVRVRPGIQQCDLVIDAGERALWWPNGMGEQALYPLCVRLCDEQGETDRYEQRVGFRTLTYARTEGAPESALPYQAIVNGRPVFLKGVNFVPLHHLYGCADEATYRDRLTKARDANVNAMRVWGGGMIEKEVFYDLCDELGILVWQDFIQSSAGGFADFPAKDPAFLALLRETATFAVQTRRNHVCLTYWCGGNELTDDRYPGEERVPVGYEDANIALLRGIEPDSNQQSSTSGVRW